MSENNWANAALGIGGGMIGGAVAYMAGLFGKEREPTPAELKSELEYLKKSHEIANRALTNSAVALSAFMDQSAEALNDLRKERLVIETLKEERLEAGTRFEKELSIERARADKAEKLLAIAQAQSQTGPMGPVGSGG